MVVLTALIQVVLNQMVELRYQIGKRLDHVLLDLMKHRLVHVLLYPAQLVAHYLCFFAFGQEHGSGR